MYLSHPVRRIRDEPAPGEDVTLVVTAGSASVDALREAAADAGGEVTAELRFDAYRVRLPQERVDEFCATPGLDRVETDNAVGYAGDSGEDR